MEEQKNAAIELRNITKTFGKVVANKNVSLRVNRGEILSILGENGSGKTTLMNMISGIYFPDEGQIFIDGKEAVIASPKDAFDYKIGMIHSTLNWWMCFRRQRILYWASKKRAVTISAVRPNVFLQSANSMVFI